MAHSSSPLLSHTMDTRTQVSDSCRLDECSSAWGQPRLDARGMQGAPQQCSGHEQHLAAWGYGLVICHTAAVAPSSGMQHYESWQRHVWPAVQTALLALWGQHAEGGDTCCLLAAASRHRAAQQAAAARQPPGLSSGAALLHLDDAQLWGLHRQSCGRGHSSLARSGSLGRYIWGFSRS
jgi:hypothetical protein